MSRMRTESLMIEDITFGMGGKEIDIRFDKDYLAGNGLQELEKNGES